MDRTERFYKIDQLLKERTSTPIGLLIDELGVSRATVKRDLEYMRDRLHAPIAWSRETGGYRFEKPPGDQPAYELPGLWFNASELHALITMEHLLSDLQPDLLAPHIKPLKNRIRALIESGDHSAGEVVKRIKVIHMAARPVEPQNFQMVARALLQRQRLRIHHYNRVTDKNLERDVSPQRMVYYRDNWYLDAWCHTRKALRSFGMDVVRDAVALATRSKNVAEDMLDRVLGSGYGIFSGSRTHMAVLRFTPQRARWVSREEWHPQQVGQFDQDGRYVLEFPYANDTELVMDILRYIPDVEVIKPATLRRRVRDCLSQGLEVFRD